MKTKMTIDLDDYTIGDAADLEAGFIFESYWTLEFGGISIVADIVHEWGIEHENLETDSWTGPLRLDKSYWFFGDNTHQVPALSAERICQLFGVNNPEDIEVTFKGARLPFAPPVQYSR